MMMARAMAKVPRRISANAVTGGGFAVVSALLIYGAQVVMPDMQKRMDENNRLYLQQITAAQEKFTAGLRDQGDRAVSIINHQQEKFALELDKQRSAQERNSERLAGAIDALRTAIERKKE